MNWKKPSSVILSLIVLSLLFGSQTFAQERVRIVSNDQKSQPPLPNQTYKSSQPTQNPTVSRQPLTNNVVVGNNNNSAPLVKKTVLSTPTGPVPSNFANNSSLAVFNNRLMTAMQSKLGIPYLYGSTGPRRYDCSGIVWSVFQDAGFPLNRASARSYWQQFEPVYGDERYKFGTLVFFNNLGHMGIVVDKDTFYQASSSKGVTFSKFEGYWEKRIVGFRRIPLNAR
jgi:cell wall-associated NlpC family hydrolase